MLINAPLQEHPMNTQEDVRGFLAQKTLALVGLSRDPKSFSSQVFQDLKAKGFEVLAVNPNVPEIRGTKCYPNLTALPRKVGGAVFFTPPTETEKVIKEAAGLGIKHLWIQQGAESDAAIQFCKDKNLAAISGQCLLMFAEPAGFHGVHRWFKRLFGGTPK
jgi:predicted CoA-binding protein